MKLSGEVGGLRRWLGKTGSEDGEVGDKIRQLLRDVEEHHGSRGQMISKWQRPQEWRDFCRGTNDTKGEAGNGVYSQKHHASCLGPWLEYAVRNSLLRKAYVSPQVCINQFLPHFLKGMAGGTGNFNNKQVSSAEGGRGWPIGGKAFHRAFVQGKFPLLLIFVPFFGQVTLISFLSMATLLSCPWILDE